MSLHAYIRLRLLSNPVGPIFSKNESTNIPLFESDSLLYTQIPYEKVFLDKMAPNKWIRNYEFEIRNRRIRPRCWVLNIKMYHIHRI